MRFHGRHPKPDSKVGASIDRRAAHGAGTHRIGSVDQPPRKPPRQSQCRRILSGVMTTDDCVDRSQASSEVVDALLGLRRHRPRTLSLPSISNRQKSPQAKSVRRPWSKRQTIPGNRSHNEQQRPCSSPQARGIDGGTTQPPSVSREAGPPMTDCCSP